MKLIDENGRCMECGCENGDCTCGNDVLVAMSHNLTLEQRQDLQKKGYNAVISKKYMELGCNRLAPTLTSKDLRGLAIQLVKEAKQRGCNAVAMTGEPMLTYFVWREALAQDLNVLQSTTERKTTEVIQEDGSVLKTQVFAHVQWRKL